MKSNDNNRVVQNIALGVLTCLIVLMAFQKQHWDSDIFWALKTGQWIIENLSVPKVDILSYSFGGHEWIDFTWGFQVIVYFIHTWLGGWTGLALFQCALLLSTFFFLYKTLMHLTSGRRMLCVGLLYMTYIVAYGRFMTRPHLFAYFFIALFFYLCTLYMAREKKIYLVMLLILQVLWTNIHSSFVLGVFIVGAYALGMFIDDIRHRGLKSEISPRLKYLILASFLLIAVSFINPYGWKLVVFPFVHMGGANSDVFRHIGEWQPLPLLGYFDFHPVPQYHFFFRVFIGLSVIFMLRDFRRIKARDVIIFLPVLYMSLQHLRWVMIFAFFAAPVLASNLGRWLDYRAQSPRYLKAVITAMIAFILIFHVHGFVIKKHQKFGVGIKTSVFPEATVEFLRREGIKDKMFNDFIFGGYISYFYPGSRIFIDTRTPTLYPPYFFWKYRLALMNKEERVKLVDEYGIDVIIVMTKSRICTDLRDDSGWVAVSFDDVSILYLRNVEKYKAVIDKFGLKYLNPCNNGKKYDFVEADKKTLNGIKLELNRLITYHSESGLDGRIAMPHRLLGLVSSLLGGDKNLEEAIKQFKIALSIDYLPSINYDIGIAVGKLKRYDEALVYLKKARKVTEEAYLAEGIIHHELGEDKKALLSLKKYLLKADDLAVAEAYRVAGDSCVNLKKYDMAIEYLKRYAFLIEGKKEKADIFYKIANIYIEQKELEPAVAYYIKATSLEPEYRGVIRSLSKSFKKLGMEKESAALQEISKGRE